MDPELELAIKVSEYLEFVWDGNFPTFPAERAVSFSALIPEDRRSADRIFAFLSPCEERKPRLRRAAKCSGLWMQTPPDDADSGPAGEYVPPASESSGSFLDLQRRFDPAGAKEQILQTIAHKSAGLIAADLDALTISFADYLFSEITSVWALQYQIASHFFANPSRMSEVAEALRYIPSFAIRVAEAIVNSAPREAGQFRIALERLAYRFAKRVLRGSSIDVAMGAAMRSGRTLTPTDMVRATMRQIDAEAVEKDSLETRTQHLAHLNAPPIYVIALYLLARKDWCIAIADGLRIPAPFGVLLTEEMQHVDARRAHA